MDGDEFLAGLGVPDLHRVPRSRGQALTVGAVHHALDKAGVALQGRQVGVA